MNRTLIILGALALIAIGAFSLTELNKEPLPTIQALKTSAHGITASLAVPDEKITAGEKTRLTFRFTDAAGNPYTDFAVHHARAVHTLVVSRDLKTIGHVHPDDFGLQTEDNLARGEYPVAFTFPKAGRYIVGVDVMTPEGPLAAQFLVNVAGSPGQERVSAEESRVACVAGLPQQGEDRYVDPVTVSDITTSCGEGYRVELSTAPDDVRAGEEVKLGFHVEKGGEPVTDLAPYLDAALHLAIVPASFDSIATEGGAAAPLIHAHGFADDRADTDHEADAHADEHGDEEESHGHVHRSHLPESFGPRLESESIVFPKAGLYRIFAQVKHNGNILFVPFMLEVSEAVREEDARVFDLSVVERALTPEIVEVTQGDPVIFRVTTDEPAEFHITGYEIEKQVSTTSPTEIVFTANQAGRYDLELHPGAGGHGEHDGEDVLDIVIGAFIVQPN